MSYLSTKPGLNEATVKMLRRVNLKKVTRWGFFNLDVALRQLPSHYKIDLCLNEDAARTIINSRVRSRR